VGLGTDLNTTPSSAQRYRSSVASRSRMVQPKDGWAAKYVSPQPDTTRQQQQPVDSAGEAGQRIVDPWDVGHPQVPP
jgi:hypothetical protein